MNGNPIRLVMLDIDGTIVDSPRHSAVTRTRSWGLCLSILT